MPAVEVVGSSGDPLVELERLGRRVEAMPAAERAAWLGSLAPHRLRTVEYALGQIGRGWRADPSTFGAHLDPRFRRWRYVALLGAAFRRAADGVEPRQIWMLPSRYGKSRIASQVGPAWALDRDPTSNIILASYAYSLARENAVGVRDLISERPRLVRAKLRRDRRRQDRFVTTAGGGLLAAGVGGGMVGFGAGGGLIGAGGGIVLDDLFRNWVAAHSEAERLRVWNWYLSVVRLRLNTEQTFIIHVTTRWHPDDVVGRQLAAALAGDGDQWTVYRIPALAEPPSDDYPAVDLLGREPGEVIEPDRFPLDAVKARHRALGSYLTAGMEQQRPAPEEGDELLRSWWRWRTLDGRRRFDDAVTSWDMTLGKAKAENDFVVGQCWHRYASTAHCVEQLRGQWNLPTTRAAIALMAVRHPTVHKHLIENTGNGPEVIEALRRGLEHVELDDATCGELGIARDERDRVEAMLRRGISGIIPVTPKGDKVARARAVSGFLEAGDVSLDEGAAMGWGLVLVNEAAGFPRGDHDDCVDAWSQAMSYLLSTHEQTFQRPDARRRIELPRPGHVGPRRPR